MYCIICKENLNEQLMYKIIPILNNNGDILYDSSCEDFFAHKNCIEKKYSAIEKDIVRSNALDLLGIN